MVTHLTYSLLYSLNYSVKCEKQGKKLLTWWSGRASEGGHLRAPAGHLLGLQCKVPPKKFPNLKTISFFLHPHPVWSSYTFWIASLQSVFKRFSPWLWDKRPAVARSQWKLLVSRNHVFWLWVTVSSSAGSSMDHWWMMSRWSWALLNATAIPPAQACWNH